MSTTKDAAATSATNGVPWPGTDAWAAYERRYTLLIDLSKGFDTLLEREPPMDSYSEEVELTAESGEVLLEGIGQYKQLLATLRNVHGALSASPLLTHSFTYRFVGQAKKEDEGDEKDEEGEVVRVEWRYALEGLGSGRSVAVASAVKVEWVKTCVGAS